MSVDKLIELRGLHPLAANLGSLLADGLIALAIGLLIACLVVLIYRQLTTRFMSPEQTALQRLKEVAKVSGSDGLTARARILQDMAQFLPEEGGDWLNRVDQHLGGFFSDGSGKGLRNALYQPGVSLDLSRFDADLKASLERAGR